MRKPATWRALVPAMLLAACAHSSPPAPIIGSIVPPYPGGLKEIEGACAGSGNAAQACGHSIAVLAGSNLKPSIVYAGRLVDRDAAGRSRWLVTDALPYPKTSKRDVLLIWTCLYKGEPDGSALAIVRDPSAAAKRASAWAYRADPESGRFVRLDPADVACYMPQGDGDE